MEYPREMLKGSTDALLLATPPSFLIATYNTPGYISLWGLLLSPTVLDRKVGRSSHRQRLDVWAEGAFTEV